MIYGYVDLQAANYQLFSNKTRIITPGARPQARLYVTIPLAHNA